MPSRGRRHRGQGAGHVTEEGTTNSPQVTLGNANYDGPSDTRGRSPSNAGQSQTGLTASRTHSSSKGPATGEPTQQADPAGEQPVRTARVLSKNVDFGGEAYNVLQNTGYVSIVFNSSLSAMASVLVLHT